MYPTQDQINAVVERITLCLSKCFDSEDAYPLIEVSFVNDLKRTAGAAEYFSGVSKIELNAEMLVQNFDDFMNFTIPHEVAHILTEMFYPDAKRDHGKEFRKMCNHIGFPEAGRTYHTYDVLSITGVKPKLRHVYACNCVENNRYNASAVMHKRIFQGERRNCKRCNFLWYTGETKYV